MEEQHRLRVLDGLRAVAILLVIGYHYFVRWTPPLSEANLYPYGDLGAHFWLFEYGDFGVELFFIISGFVISMTLFRCRSIGHFFWKRFSRLFPTMLICSLLTFAVLHALPQNAFSPQWRDFLPSLTFTDPLLWSKAFGTPFKAVDGAYWSLFVEVKFYLWVSVIYFTFGAQRFFRAFAWLFGALVLAYLGMRALDFPHLWGIDFVFALSSLPWFVAGIGFYALYADADSRIGRVLLVEAVVALAALQLGLRAGTVWPLIVIGLSYAVFLAFLFRPRWVAWLGYRPLAAVGVASYSLYLLHQSIGVAILDMVRQHFGTESSAASALLAPLLAVAMILASLAVYRLWEVPAKNALLSWAAGRRSASAAVDQPVREAP